MKKSTVIIASLIVITVLCFIFVNKSRSEGGLTLRGDILWTPPGYDMVTGAYVNVYQGYVGGTLAVNKNFRFHYDLISDMVTGWQTSDKRGHGFKKFTTAYAWEPEKFLWTSEFKADIGPENRYFYITYKVPHDRHDLEGFGRGHGRATEYYGGLGLHITHEMITW